MKTALSGTPGVGKTMASEILRNRGWEVLDINKIAGVGDFVVGYDNERDSKIIDVEKLDDYLSTNFTMKDFLIEGHLSHLLSVDIAIILRCDPLVLKERLSTKGWAETKIMENVGAEILDVIKVEALEAVDTVYEVDTTHRTNEEVADAIVGILMGNYTEPHIGWLEEYEYLLFESKTGK